MENNDNNINWIAKLLSKNASASEQQALEQWRKNPSNDEFYTNTEKVWEILDQAEDLPKEVNVDKAWATFENKLQARQTTKPKGRTLSLWIQRVAVAAVLTLGVFGYWWTQSNANQEVAHQTAAGEKLEVQLPDGSKVILNENSQLAYNQKFTPRTITLTGEAFFEVTKSGETFTVNTENSKVTVLGTSFNVRAYTDQPDAEVAVLTGKVAVDLAKSKQKKGILLVAGEKVVLDNNRQELIKLTTNTENAVSWQTQKLNFKNTRLAEVVSSLEHHFGIEIQAANNILNCHFTGKFTAPKLEEVLKTIAFSLDLKVDEKSAIIQLSGQGCETSISE